LYLPAREFFVAYAVAQATGIKIAFSAGGDRAARLTLELAAMIKTEASVDSAKDRSGHIVISSPEPITFGLAVVQLVMDGSSLRFKAANRLRAVRGEGIKPETAEDIPRILFGGSEGDAMVEIG